MRFEDLGLAQAASEIRAGRISPVEYAQALLSRIDRLEPDLSAWVTIDRTKVLKEAKACEDEIRGAQIRGPLHGVPIGLKDIFRTKGLRTTAGSRFLQDYVPDCDAHAVTQLKRAGAIILGKTVTTEFATYDPGPTRNPWNPAHTPGGSSSGSAAAVAARMCPAATGTQTVGSIGRPAAYCGTVGFMPTQACVSRSGVFPVSWSLDHIGGFTRSVSDARLFLEGLSGEAIPFLETPKPVPIGVVRGFFSEKATPETRDLHEKLLHRLDSRLFVIEEALLPEIFNIQAAILRMIMRPELASVHADFHRMYSAAYSHKLRGLVETGMLVSSSDYLRALRLRRIYQREMVRLFEKFDILITPGAMDTAPEGLSNTGDPGFTGPWALADFPTITLPHALASNKLPVAIQISAAPMQEDKLFSVATLLETAIGFHHHNL
jgi:aspartyl-tRNA(Asn)/glutamyl-tRNA(Gln) amidotransferase subunit A